MSPKVKRIFLNFILITICISSVSCCCYFSVPEDILLRPHFTQRIGTRTTDLVVNEEATGLEILENQEIEAHCNVKFDEPSEFRSENSVKMSCVNGRIRVHNMYEQIGICIQLVRCSSQNWNLYETSQNFVWCPTNTSTSYILARPMAGERNETQYLAGICYDTTNFALKSIYYTISAKSTKHVSPTVLADFYTPSLEIMNFKQILNRKSATEFDFDSQEINDWLKLADYTYSSIMQNTLLLNEFDDKLGSLLHLPWWPNLRLGNWKLYEMALTKQVESQHQSYDILAGVSAVAIAPVREICEENYTLKELTDNRHTQIPMYVWNYLRSTSNSSDEIVVIGFNSPFYEFYQEEDVVFCADKCQEIAWLEKVHSTFRYSPLGIIFCCSVEDVRSSKRLENFPEIDISSKPHEPVTMEPITVD